MNNNMSTLYNERYKRVQDAIALKNPDRIPIIPIPQAFPIFYSGNTTMQDAMEDFTNVGPCFDNYYKDFKPDLGWGPGLIFPASAIKACGLNYLQWPGNGVEEQNHMYQFIEGEFMKGDEYDEFARDPTHFIQTKWIPRCFSKLKGLENLNLSSSLWMGWLGSFAAFANQDLIDSLDALKSTAVELIKWFEYIADYDRKLEQEWHIPIAWGANAFAPFDLIGDTMRGTVEIMQDILLNPEGVLKAVNAIMPAALEAPVAQCKASGRKNVWIWLHKGVDDFMSPDQYKTFYWPTLQKLIVGLVEEGLTPYVYCEGSYNQRLEILRDVPVGKVVYDFETVDMVKAKEVLGDVACIAGNVPNAMLAFGTPEDVDAYCKDLILNVGRDGGFMLSPGGLVDNAKTENMRAMFDSVEKYS